MSGEKTATATTEAPVPQPQGVIEDIVTSILTPGYVGNSVWNIMVGTVALFSIVIIVHAYNDPTQFNLLSLLILIPAIGLLFSFKWCVSCFQRQLVQRCVFLIARSTKGLWLRWKYLKRPLLLKRRRLTATQRRPRAPRRPLLRATRKSE